MTRSGRTLVIAALGASAVIASFALRCARSADVTPPPEDTTSGAENAPAPVAEPSAARAPDPEPAPAEPATQLANAPDAASPTAPAADNSIARALHATDEHDRALLSGIERSTHADPPPAARELLALRHRGASRAELDRFIAENLHDDLRVRIAAQRWARAVAPLPSDPPPPADSSFGHGGGAQRIKPIAPKSH